MNAILALLLLFSGFQPPVWTVAAHGRLLVDEGKPLPEDLSVEIWATEMTVDSPRLQFDVKVDDRGNFVVLVPRQGFDLRLASDSFVPVYRWGLEAESRASFLDLGEFQLEIGSSLAGFAIDEAGYGVPGVDVALELLGLSPIDPEDSARRDSLIREASTDEQGFFQLTGVQPGKYRLILNQAEAQMAGLVEPVTIAHDSEVFFPRVQVAGYLTLQVHVSPSAAPSGQHWIVKLHRDQAELDSGTVDESGQLRFSGLYPGRYAVWLESRDGSRVSIQNLELIDNTVIEMAPELVWIDGTVHLDSEPLVADLSLMTGQSDEVTMVSDEEGSFVGWFPRPTWNIIFLRIRSDEPDFEHQIELTNQEIDDGLLTLNIDLQSVRVQGRVIATQTGQPVENAEILIAEPFRSLRSTSSTTDGHFDFVTLEGRYRLKASKAGVGASQWTQIDASGSAAPDLLLQLSPVSQRSAILVSRSGQPITGAEVKIVLAGNSGGIQISQTDVQGRFEFHLPDSENSLPAVIQVAAPSLGLLWSGCVSVPAQTEQDWSLSLPATTSGVLELLSISDRDAPPPRDGELTLLTADGGFLGFNDLFRWHAAVDALSFDSQTDIEHRTTIRGLATGTYAAVFNREPWPLLAAHMCSGQATADTWSSVTPSTPGEVRVDLRRYQPGFSESTTGGEELR